MTIDVPVLPTVVAAHAGTPTRVLVVDDNPGDAHLAIAALEGSTTTPFEACVAETVAGALEQLRARAVDVVLLDLGLPDASGLDGLHRIGEAAPHLPIVMLTGNDQLSLAEAALQAGAQDYLVKSDLAPAALERTLRYAQMRQELKGALEASRRWAHALIHSVSDIVTIHRADGTIAHVGGLGTGVFPRSADLDLGELRRRVDRQTWRRMVRTFCRWRKGEQIPLEFCADLGDGRERCYESVASDLLGDPLIGGIVVTSRDVTDRHQIQRRLSHEATHDPLTGLGNRALFNQRLQEALDNGQAVAVLLLDLDDFKKVNDSFGHAAGDEVLLAVANLLTVAVRGQDTLARLGGDEFVLVCPGVDLPSAERIAARLQRVLVRPFQTGGREVFLNASIGIAHSTGGASAEALFRDADLALYESKRTGKSRVSLFSDDLETRAVRKMEIETELRGAITRGELSLHYQPVLDLATGHVAGYEALLRWWHPKLGEVDPDEFIQVAEQSGLIVPVGRWVLEQGCQQIARWRGAHPDRDFHLAVNVSAKQLAEASFVAELIGVLERTGVPARAICLEVTETAVIGELAATGAVLQRLRAAGIRLALDDFGTGYSSLTYLKRLPVDVLKIDRSFTDGIAHHPDDRAVVASVVHMAGALGVDVVAEGVEDAEQRDALRELGCGFAQGFLWSRALPADRAGALLDARFDVGDDVVPSSAGVPPSRSRRQVESDDTLAVVAHELMQPLTVIRGFADGFHQLSETEDPAALVAAISRNASNAIELVSSLADAGALERGTLDLQFAGTSLARIVTEVVGDLEGSLDGAVDVVVDGDAEVEVDAGRVRQIITNLLTNAAKFSPPGTTVVVHVHADADRGAVSVIDSGPGVAPDGEAQLFRRFARLGRHKGTGLGLYISRQLARLHGGDLTYRRAGTGGAQFTLALPAAGSRDAGHVGASTRAEEPATVGQLSTSDAVALAALHRATRSLLAAEHAEVVVGATIQLVRALGGRVVPAAFADESALPLDLAMGEGPPLLPAAPPLSVARLRLEQVLPLFSEDARDVMQRLRVAATSTGSLDPDTGLVGAATLADLGKRQLRCAVAVPLPAPPDERRTIVRLLRSVTEADDLLVRWADDTVVIGRSAGPSVHALRDDIVDEWLRWGNEAALDVGIAEAQPDGTPAGALLQQAIADLGACR